jgi:DNA repair protein RadC
VWDRLLKTLRRTETEPFPDAPTRRVSGMAERPAASPTPAPAPAPQSVDGVGLGDAGLDHLPFPSTGPLGHRARMRERLLERGAESLADYELLEMLLFLAFKKGDTKPLAKSLINRFGSYAGVLVASPERLAVEPGVGPHSVAAIKLVQASAERLARAELADQPILNNWDRLIDYLTIAMAREPIEQFRILFLDNRNRLIANEIASRGTVNHTQVYVREVVKRALELHATALILVHNHPSGDPTASRDDIAMTAEIERAIQVMDIVLHDHLIIGKGRFLSFRQQGLIGRAAGRA